MTSVSAQVSSKQSIDFTHQKQWLDSAQSEADQSTQRTLLNCFIREIARTKNLLQELISNNVIETLPLGWRYRQKKSNFILLELPETQGQMMIAVGRKTRMGSYRYSFPVLARSTEGNDAAWRVLKANELAKILIAEICKAQHVPFNCELHQQILLSMETKTGILNNAKAYQEKEADQQSLYLFSEQSLAYGHAYHPTPKCRQWEVSEGDRLYGPEYRQSFSLHWFAVQQDYLRVETVAPLTRERLIADIVPQDMFVEDGYQLIPVHPAQAHYLLQLPTIQEALTSGRLQDHGIQGEAYYPTASVRTLYNPNKRWFLKGSLNVRITNCIRKNAIYELESALAINRRLQLIEPLLRAYHSGFRLLDEPGFLTINLPNLCQKQATLVQEGFGMVVRQNIDGILEDGEEAVLAGALFQQGNALQGKVYIEDKLAWMKSYAEALIPPMLAAYFEHGLIFEPHLQNTVICLKKDLPSGVVLRDFEGVKLVDQYWPEESLKDMSLRARASVQYTSDQGWDRVCYCLFINNIVEAITWLADDQPNLEVLLWERVREVIVSFQIRINTTSNDNAELNRRLDRLLAGEPLPGKTNLMVRLSKRPDKAADYVPVPSPFAPVQLAAMDLPKVNDASKDNNTVGQQEEVA